VFLAEVGKRSSWVWAACARPKASAIACGCEDGSITMFNVTVGTVHALHGDRYAYREHMTDVVVQHLITEQKVRIRCRWVRAAAAAVVHKDGCSSCRCWRRCW
jgi:intraflagellar transport protein 122